MKSLMHRRHREEVLSRLDDLRPDARRRWGRMSVGAMVCHLTDAFLIVMGERPAERTPKLHERTLMRWMALSTPLPWPKGVPTMSACDQEKGGTPPGELAADRERLRETIDRFLARIGGGEMVHPIFGRLSNAEWGRWGYRHMDHHLRQFGT